MFGIDTEQFGQMLTVIGLAVIAVFIGTQKLLKDWKSTNAETNIIQLMHTELERMSEQNSTLSTEVGKLHSEIISLSTQLHKLTIENQRLQIEIGALTEEISMLKQTTNSRKESNHATY
jgi:peptidoglycan hydrolase CwlO-like protein